MRDDARRGIYNETEVEERLADAGRVLLTLPWAGCFPCGFRCPWPETDSSLAVRRRPPTSLQIDAMDQAYTWTAHIRNQDERRLVLMRSLVLPVSTSGKPRHVWTWGRLRRSTGLHPDTLQKRWRRGIRHIVFALNAPPEVSPDRGSIALRFQGVPYGFGPIARRAGIS
jgi:hypothetical protein